MSMFAKLRALFRKEKLDAEMSEEMRHHLDAQMRRNLAAGMSLKEAHHAAQRSFGGVEQIKERARDQRAFIWLEQFGQDVRLGLRSLAKAPGFSLVAIGTLALGIGACTAVYSVVDGLLLHPIGHDPHTEREVQIVETHLPNQPSSRVSPANFLDWQQRTTSFSSMRAGGGTGLLLTGEAEPIRLSAGRATYQFLEPHAWTLALGRGFLPEEDKPGRNKVVIVSYGIWQRLLGGDPHALGRSLQINGEPHTLVGVISEEVGRFSAVDAWVPIAFTDEERAQRGNRNLGVWARLKPDVTLEQARAEMNVIAAQLAQQHPDTNAGWGVAIVPVIELQGGGGLRQALWTLLGAVGCVLLIACANVANLLLARATARQQEMAVRAALGAGRVRLVRQLLTESMLLALVGGAGGVLLAHWGLQALHGYAAPGMARLGYVQLNLAMLGVAVVLSVATGLVFGLVPAWFAARADLNGVLKQGARGATEGGARRRLRNALVVIEVALAIVLLASSGALIRRFAERTRLDAGFVPEKATVLQLGLTRQNYATPAKQAAFADAVLERLRNVPGVQAAGATTSLPTQPPVLRFQIDGRPSRPRSDWPAASAYAVTPDYFAAMKIRLWRGRVFTALDQALAPRVVVINETLARQFFPGENPIGRRITFGSGPDTWREIVGIAGDVTQFGADTETPPQIYEPFAQNPALNLSFVIRAAGDPAAIFSSLKPQVYAVDQNQPVSFVRPLQDVLDERVTGPRFAMHLLAVFSFIALAIAAVGIYAVVAYTVSQRTTEFGVRLALGAQASDVRRLVLAFGARTVGLGLVAGVGAAIAAGRTVESMLYHVNARAPLTLAAIALLLAVVSLLACLLPARRAARVDPMVALRCE